jgi:hypothetical protein
VVNKISSAFFSFLFFACTSYPVYATDSQVSQISAEAIRAGCFIVFSKTHEKRPEPTLGIAPADLRATWSCRDGTYFLLDEYGVNGGDPEIVTILYWKRRDIVVLVRWPINSQAADYSGDYYKVFVYRGEKKSTGYRFHRDDKAMSAFGEGVDGVDRNGAAIHYAYKDAASIRNRLRKIH